MAAPKKRPPKGIVPPQLVGKGFDVHPEHRNKHGAPRDAIELRKLIQEVGSQKIRVAIKSMKGKTTAQMTRFERIVYEWFESQDSKKQEMLIQYGFGKVPDKLEVSGLKTIVVTLKKKSEEGE